MGYRRSFRVFLLLLGVFGLVLVCGLVLASVGYKEQADRFWGGALTISFGAACLAGVRLNFLYIGEMWDNRRGYCSMTHRRSAYLRGIVLGAVCSVAVIIAGIVLLLWNIFA